MRNKFAIISILTIISLGVSLVLNFWSPELSFYSIPVHSIFEAISAIFCIFLALFFLIINRYELAESSYLYSASGLVSMGVLDLFHGSVLDQNLFVWLRAMANFMGALGFSLVWFHKLYENSKILKVLPYIFFFLSLLLGLGSICFPSSVPLVIEKQMFTPFVRNLHILIALLFFVASLRYFSLPLDQRDNRNLYLGSFCYLQFLAASLFSFSVIWSADWWWWHFLRLAAGVVLMLYVFFVQIKLQERLKMAVSLRDDFIAIASHELKTPLSAMKLQARMLQKYDIQKEKFEWILHMFNKEITRITRAVDELLEISRITSDQLSMNFSETNLGNVVKDAVAMLNDDFGRDPNLNMEIDENVIGNWDEFRLTQIVVNFLTNAKRYGEGKPIEVKVYRKDGMAVFSVRDHGKGISKEDQMKIFERYKRVKRDPNIPGLGIGLFISKKIAEAHQGRIEINSIPGQGAEFRFVFPINSVNK